MNSHSSIRSVLFLVTALVGLAQPPRLSASEVVFAAAEPTDGADLVTAPMGMEEPEGTYDPAARWYGQVDSLWMFRGKGCFPQAYVVDVRDSSITYRAADDLYPGLQFGPRVMIGRAEDEGHAWEASYFGLFNGSMSTTVRGNGNLAIPGDLGLASLDYYAADVMTATYSTQLHNIELNRVRTEDDFSFLAGVRYVNLRETFNLASGDVNLMMSNYHIASSNHLVGGQIGMRRVHDWRAFQFLLGGTAGIYGNACSQDQSVEDFVSFAPYYLRPPTSGSTVHVAFVGDINLVLNYALSDRWTLRMGYNLLWLNGVALAPNQLDFSHTATSGTGVNCGAMLFLHGAIAGLEGRW